MSEKPVNLDVLVHEKFHEAFGPPHNALNSGEQWQIKPFQDGISINILLNGSRGGPSIWVFDPHNAAEDGVIHTTINEVSQVDSLIGRIRKALELAAIREKGRLTHISDRNGSKR